VGPPGVARSGHAGALMTCPAEVCGESETPQRIREAAHDLFARQGYHGTSVRTIARQAGVSQGQVTYHFGSKAALFEATVDEAHHVLERLAIDLPVGRGAAIRLRIFMDGLVTCTRARRAIRILVWASFVPELDRSWPPPELVDLVRRMIREGQCTGSVGEGKDAALLAVSLLGAVLDAHAIDAWVGGLAAEAASALGWGRDATCGTRRSAS
jgi:AcrR family transcriptional regulator